MIRAPGRALATLVVVMLIAFALALAVGPQGWPSEAILRLRLSRAELAIIVGSGLACTGTVLQALSGNPLADPSVIGASSGAAVGIVVARWCGIALTSPLLPLFSVLGAYAAIMLVLRIARTGGRTPVQTLLLAGVTVGTLGLAIVLLYYNFHTGDAGRTMLFLMGSLGESKPELIALAAGCVAICIAAATLSSRALDAFCAGETSAHHLGIDVERYKIGFCLLSAALVGVIVAVAGMIGFVGLIVPHVARALVGHAHRWLIPASAIAGAAFLLLADLVARTAAEPLELSIGAITAFCGGPFFLLLLRRRVRERDVLARSDSTDDRGRPR
ncbi:MAG: iron ABC transporter permease [Planctomycetes bacterium]|nr:iron ABC transporter permease [Planctomycetota bacterium]